MTAERMTTPAPPEGADAATSRAQQLRVDGLDDALAASLRPTLSWTIAPATTRRCGPRVQLRRCDPPSGAPLWDSGILAAEQLSVEVPVPLEPAQRHRWTVEYPADPDAAGAPTTAESTFCTTAEVGAVGRWIAAPWSSSGTRTPTDPVGEPRFTRTVDVDDPPSLALLTVCGLGLHHVTIDGLEVDDQRLGPAVSDYRRRCYTVTSDVTDLLAEPGGHQIDIGLGNGFFAQPTPTVWGWHEAPWTAHPRLFAELHLRWSDGRRQVIGSGDDWLVGTGGTTLNCFYAGEAYDPSMITAPARSAVVVPGPGGELVPTRHPPIRVRWSGAPTWTRIADSWVADFGRTIAGWVELRCAQPAGRPVRISYAEQLDDGRAVPVNQHVEGGRFQVDSYVGDGTDRQRWQPRYTYKGFRYVQLDGLFHPPDEATLTAHLAHNDVEQIGDFGCAEPLLETFVSAMRSTVANNLHHLPTDTPMYEKNGWTGDVQLGAGSMLGLLDTGALLSKWLIDVRDAQHENGSIYLINPTPGWGDSNLGPSPEWTTVYPFLARLLYAHHGSTDLLCAHWTSILRYLDWEDRHLQDGLATSRLGDYLPPGVRGVGPYDTRSTASAYLVRGLRMSAEIGRLLADGRSAGAVGAVELGATAAELGATAIELDQRADALVAAINTAFLHRAAARYVVGEDFQQTVTAVTLLFGIAPVELTDQLATGLADDVRSHDDHLDVGCLGAATVLSALTDHGHGALALRVARQTSYPGWGFWFAHGADTMWEMWDLKSRSRNHYFQGTIAQWLIEEVVGLRAPDHGWRTFQVRPRPIGDLAWARHRLRTPRGEASVSWHRSGADVEVDVAVPVGAKAQVVLPDGRSLLAAAGQHQFRSTVAPEVDPA